MFAYAYYIIYYKETGIFSRFLLFWECLQAVLLEKDALGNYWRSKNLAMIYVLATMFDQFH